MRSRDLTTHALVGLLGILVFTGTARDVKSQVLPRCIDAVSHQAVVPPNWNGTLLLYSHGYAPASFEPPPLDIGGSLVDRELYSKGYALAGSAYSSTGWALDQAFDEQIALLDLFPAQCGEPTRTIAWGESLGGIISAGLVQNFPERFQGALPMCGVLGGGIGAWNEALDGGFVFVTLLPHDHNLQIVGIVNPELNLAWAELALESAQRTPAGRARLALVAAVTDLPGWFDFHSAEPVSGDFTGRVANQVRWLRERALPFQFRERAYLERRAGGNPSWNTEVNYRQQLNRSINKDEVDGLYKAAQLGLDEDLQTLERAQRVSSDSNAVDYLKQHIIFSGQIQVPVLSMHTTHDGLVSVEHEQAYEDVVRSADNEGLLRQVFIHRASHCMFTPAETLAAVEALLRRLDTGDWDGTDSGALNAEAAALGPEFNTINGSPVGPGFVQYAPSSFLRMYDQRD